MSYLGIIGTAGRNGLHSKMGMKTVESVTHTILPFINSETTLVSGGAAWMDHTAVVLSLDRNIPIILYLPCEWDFKNRMFVSNNSTDWRTNPGGTLNYYHNLMHQQTKVSSLDQLHELLHRRYCEFHTFGSFHRRNTEIAHKSDLLLAFTFSQENVPSDGGTLDTWNKSVCEKKHFTLGVNKQ